VRVATRQFTMSQVQWLLLCESVFLCLTLTSSLGQLSNCELMTKTYSDKGWSLNNVPEAAVSGAELWICPENETCCTKDMENRLLFESKKEMKDKLNSALSPVKNIFESSTRDFNDYFGTLLNNSVEHLEKNVYFKYLEIYSELERELQSYYSGADKDLKDAMKNFYKSLFKSFLQLNNPHHQFDHDYMSCVADNMDTVKPFKYLADKHTGQVRGCLVMARTFVQGLAVGRDVIHHVMTEEVTHSCVQHWMQLSYCPKCRGLETKPCRSYCVDHMQHCLSDYISLNNDWNNYVDALNRLVALISGPYKNVLHDIGTQVSSSIRTLQQNIYNMENQIKRRCGDFSSRGRRDVNNRSRGSRRRKSIHQPVDKSAASLDELVQDFQRNMKDMKHFWSHIAEDMCKNDVAGLDPDNCWGGGRVERSRREAEPEHKFHSSIGDQLDKLKTALAWMDRNLAL